MGWVSMLWKDEELGFCLGGGRGGGGYTFVINASWGLGLITVYQCCKLVLLLWRIVLIGYCL